MDYFANEVAKGVVAAKAHEAEIEAYWASDAGKAQALEEAQEEAAAIAHKEAEIAAWVAIGKEQRKAEYEAQFNVVRAPYSGKIVARYRV